jgi:Ca-activated chloride channel homolog
MSSKMDRAKDAVVEFFKTANPQDEFFMITFSDEPEVVSDFTSSVDDIQGKLVFAVPRRRTALLDAIYMGVTKMRQAKYPKKALLIISDGGRQSQPLHRGGNQGAGEGSGCDGVRDRDL